MNKVVHFEIPAEDVERAQEFYKKVFGWDVEKAGEMPYWIAKTVECDENNMPKEMGAINGGILKKDEVNDPGSSNPVIVIKVNNIEEYSKKIEDAGGTIVLAARTVMDMGLYSRVKDPEGNTIGIWQDLEKPKDL